MSFSLKQLVGLFTNPISPITEGNNRLILFAYAVKALGTDASPDDVAPDEYGCADTVCNILIKAFGVKKNIAFTVSTNLLFNELEKSPYYTRVDQPLSGDIIISPTGYGDGRLPNGHVGIIGQITGDNIVIMSNDSMTGKFLENYNLKTWRARYIAKGGYPVYFFRRI